jgi:hypothetical protein
MIAQRPPGGRAGRQAAAEALPFEDGSFDAAMAVLTIHHWTDWRAGSRRCGAWRGASSCSRGTRASRPAVDQRRLLPAR